VCTQCNRERKLEWLNIVVWYNEVGQRVVIVGGGIIGCATALELASSECEVTLIERGKLGNEASWAGAGLLCALLPWDYREEVTRLVDGSRALYPEWVGALSASGVDPEYRTSGLLVLPPYNLKKALAWAHTSGESLLELPAHTVESSLAIDAPSLWMRDVAQVRNPRLLRALRQMLDLRGVTVLESTPVSGWQEFNSRITGVLTPRGVLEAEMFVVAAGAWSGEVLGEWGAQLPVKPVRGQIVLYKTAPGRLRHMLYRDGLYIIPRDDGHVLVGSTLEDVGFDKRVTAAARESLTQGAVELLPWLKDTPIVGHWAGLRPGSTDNIPIIGRHPQIENLFINSGHYRYGVTLAPISAQLMADEILGRPSDFDMQPYRWLV
jgi:glycine oxidase